MGKSVRAERSERKASDEARAERLGNVKPYSLAEMDKHYDWLERLEESARFRSEQKALASHYEDREAEEARCERETIAEELKVA